MPQQSAWDWEITSQTSWSGTGFKELVSYKDLLLRLVRKEFISTYQQTLLGPFWALFQPLLTVLTFVMVFTKVIGISTEGVPAFLYYLTGITLWNLFADLFMSTAYTFVTNIAVFSKVYFPRIIAPLSILLLNLLRFGIQLLLLIAALLYFYYIGKVEINFGRLLLTIPAILITSGIALGSGLVFSILTTKYKDLMNLVSIIIRLLMFVCPIFFSMTMVPQKAKLFVFLNPLSSQFELFRYAVVGKGYISTPHLLYSFLFMLLLVVGGILFFNKMTDKLIDVA